MEGFKLLTLSGLHGIWNRIVNPGCRWAVDCEHCGDTQTSRSYYGAVTKNSLHIPFSDDHPDPPDYGGHDVPSEEPTKVADL